jgi:hypothetical protein
LYTAPFLKKLKAAADGGCLKVLQRNFTASIGLLLLAQQA